MEKECMECFKVIRKGNSNFITKTEFINWFSRRIQGMKAFNANKLANSMRGLFTKMDKDKSGVLS